MNGNYIVSINEIKVLAKILGHNWITGLWDTNQSELDCSDFKNVIDDLNRKQIIQIPIKGKIFIKSDIHKIIDSICLADSIITCCKNNEPYYTVYANNGSCVFLKQIGFLKFEIFASGSIGEKVKNVLSCEFKKSLLLRMDINLFRQWVKNLDGFDTFETLSNIREMYPEHYDLILQIIKMQLNVIVLHEYHQVNDYYKDEKCISLVEYYNSIVQVVQSDDTLELFSVEDNVKEVVYG